MQTSSENPTIQQAATPLNYAPVSARPRRPWKLVAGATLLAVAAATVFSEMRPATMPGAVKPGSPALATMTPRTGESTVTPTFWLITREGDDDAQSVFVCPSNQADRLFVTFASAPATKPAAVSLFNGKDLAGWKPVGTAIWKVDDGVIVGGQGDDPKRSGVLTTEQLYKDFDLELEFQIDEHGKYNSGVYLRNEPGKQQQTGYQVNIGRGAAEEYCGGLYLKQWLGKGDEKDAIRKPKEWNKLKITAQGAHVTVTLNDVKVVDYTDPTPDPKLLQPGVIALQTYGAEGHAGWVKFRNIRITPE